MRERLHPPRSTVLTSTDKANENITAARADDDDDDGQGGATGSSDAIAELVVGCLEGIERERGICWRIEDSPSLSDEPPFWGKKPDNDIARLRSGGRVRQAEKERKKRGAKGSKPPT